MGVDEVLKDAVDKAISEERMNNPRFADGLKWARIWSVLWFLIAATFFLAGRIISLGVEEVLSLTAVIFPFLDPTFIALMTFLSVPLVEFTGAGRYRGFFMLFMTAAFPLAVMVDGGGITSLSLLALLLLAVLTALVFFQPNIRYYTVRLKEIYKQNPKKGKGHLWL